MKEKCHSYAKEHILKFERQTWIEAIIKIKIEGINAANVMFFESTGRSSMWGFLGEVVLELSVMKWEASQWKERVEWDHIPGRQDNVNKGKKIRNNMVYINI